MKRSNIFMVFSASLLMLAGSAFADMNTDISKVNAYVIKPSLSKVFHGSGVSEGPGLNPEEICRLAQDAKAGLASLSSSYSDDQIAAFELFDLLGEDDTTAKDIRSLRHELSSVTSVCK